MLTTFESKSNTVEGLSFHSKRPWNLASLHSIFRSYEVIGTDQHVYITHAISPVALSLNQVSVYTFFTILGSPLPQSIGYNGIQLWKNEGFVSGEVLASTLEKEWLSLPVLQKKLKVGDKLEDLVTTSSKSVKQVITTATKSEVDKK
ncbi:unnamed protein product [Lactuca virosa]|uniref:Uncharacterized protein n=1 Tax=Lactuca virosa TaxID=75947 RepID=A0AAU9N2M7_9ASTR|nr:unnamed protein product [Lactuca virosa]